MSYSSNYSERRGGGGGGGCFSCGKEGHIARNCPQGGDGGGGGPRRGERSQTCYSCGKEGHISSQCRDGGGRGGGGGGYSRGGGQRYNDRERGYGGSERRVYNNGNPTLFVRNLTESIDQETLKTVFPDAVNWRIPNNFNGYAFVEYDSEEKMESDLDKKQNYSLNGQNLNISRSNNNSSRGGGGGGGGYRSNAPYNANNRNGGGGYYGSRGGGGGGGGGRPGGYRKDYNDRGGNGYNSGGSD